MEFKIKSIDYAWPNVVAVKVGIIEENITGLVIYDMDIDFDQGFFEGNLNTIDSVLSQAIIDHLGDALCDIKKDINVLSFTPKPCVAALAE